MRGILLNTMRQVDKIITTVKWNERWLWLKLEDDSPVSFNFSSGFECEVIGDIYKNPELLKGGNSSQG